jgi:hypothetical protein
MTTTQTFQKAILGNLAAMKIAEDSLSKNLELAGIHMADISGDKTTIYASRKGIVVSHYMGPQGHERTGFTSSSEFTWEELAKRIDFVGTPRALKLKRGKAFHTIAGISQDGVPHTYCGEGWKLDKYDINTVKQFEKDGNHECRNCERVRK